MRCSKVELSGRIAVVGMIIMTAVTMAIGAIGLGPRFITVTSGSVAIPFADLHPGEVKFYSYRDAAGSQIRSILERDNEGSIQAAVDGVTNAPIPRGLHSVRLLGMPLMRKLL